MTSPPIFRFAPSPTGLLHLGHAFSARHAFDAAKTAGGRFLLRIEDIDHTRCRPEYVAQILDDLSWLGLTWEKPVRCQSEHMDDYTRALQKLEALGITYRCLASRSEIKAHVEQRSGLEKAERDPDGALIYPGIYRNRSDQETARMTAADRPACVRINMTKAIELVGKNLTFQEKGSGPQGERGEVICNPQNWGDVVIARKDTPTSYHLSVVVDDALQGVSEVTRGQDVFYATSIHRLLQVLLELPQPDYNHHRLIKDETGAKLSKSAADKSLKAWRSQGYSVEELLEVTDNGSI